MLPCQHSVPFFHIVYIQQDFHWREYHLNAIEYSRRWIYLAVCNMRHIHIYLPFPPPYIFGLFPRHRLIETATLRHERMNRCALMLFLIHLCHQKLSQSPYSDISYMMIAAIMLLFSGKDILPTPLKRYAIRLYALSPFSIQNLSSEILTRASHDDDDIIMSRLLFTLSQRQQQSYLFWQRAQRPLPTFNVSLDGRFYHCHAQKRIARRRCAAVTEASWASLVNSCSSLSRNSRDKIPPDARDAVFVLFVLNANYYFYE